MPVPTTRATFKEYCLRALGRPVLQINVDDEQIEDRIDEAIYVYQQYHEDAVTKVYMAHEVTASTLLFASAYTGTFVNGEVLIGSTSNVRGIVTKTINATAINFFTTTSSNVATHSADGYSDTGIASFTPGEVVTGVMSTATGTIAANGITFGDMDNRWYPVVDSVISITKVFAPFDSRMSADILFDSTAQFNMSLLSNFTSSSVMPYFVGRTYQQLINDMFRGRPGVRFSRHMNRLYVDVNWRSVFTPGQHIVIEGYRTLDPDTFTDVWSDRWLQRYATALIKRQWGTHLSKFGGISLPGGVQLNGQTMLSEAVEEILKLEEQVRSEFMAPPMFITG